MTPIRTTELILQYASRISPWWLIVAIPAVVAAAWWLYTKERRATNGPSALILPAIRCLLLAALVFLAFRPSLIWREILTYPGRLVVVADNSESMTVPDTAMPADEAVLIYRRLRDEIPGVPQPFYDITMQLGKVAATLNKFQSLSRTGDRQEDEFWEQAEVIQANINETFEAIYEQANSITGISDPLRQQADRVLADLRALQERCNTLFTGNVHPGDEPFEAAVQALRQRKTQLLAVQTGADNEAGEQARRALASAASDIRSTPRLDLLAEAIEKMRPALTQALPDQIIQVVELMGEDRAQLSEFDPQAMEAVAGETSIKARLTELLEEEHDFPIAAVALLSDGLDLSAAPIGAVSQMSLRKQAPVFCGAVGSTIEPTDISILEVIAPPYAVQNSPLDIQVKMKVSLPADQAFELQITSDEEVISKTTVEPDDREAVRAVLSFTPEEVGQFRYTVRALTAGGEVLPTRNNAKDIVVNVRERKIRILFADWKPRWETRFALNILRRLDYVELNEVIVIVSKEGELQRGALKSTWPQDYATMELYDMIILGELPAGLLTAEELDWLREFVEQDGKTVMFLGKDAGAGLDAVTRRALLPLDPAAEIPGDIAELCLTAAGGAHPLGIEMSTVLPFSTENAIPGLLPETQPLMLTAPGQPPALSTRYTGNGKTAHVGTGLLWKKLNPTALAAHGSLYVNFASWAIAGDKLDPEASSTQLLLDTGNMTSRETLQVWLHNATPETSQVEVLIDEQVVAEAPATTTHEGSKLARAAFDGLPPGRAQVRVQGNPNIESRRIDIVERYPELDFFARNDMLMKTIAADTGGQYGLFTDLPALLSQIEPKQRVEKNEDIWRLWDARIVFALVLLVLTVEWVWRKLAGLV